jgi:site-specific DNA recombinase
MAPKRRSHDENDSQKRVGIWIRVSTEDQVRGESPQHHEKRARYYAESKGWRVIKVYELDAISGKSVMNLAPTQEMLADVRSGHISGLIFSKLARLARNTRELLEFSEIFRTQNADLISLQEAIDTSTPAGRLFYTMIAAMAQWEREEISERVAASVPVRAKLGKPLGGAAPFGYRWAGRQLSPDPTEAPIRRRLYELFLEHRRRKTVARVLNEAGCRTRNGLRFTDTTVTRLLQDPTAKGIRRANYTKSLGDKKHWMLKPEAEWVLSSVDPIVSEDLWDRCNAILAEQRLSAKRPARKTQTLFAGIVECFCGTKMYVPSNSPKYICRKCRNRIPETDLEAVFREQLRTFVFSPGELVGYLDETDEVLRSRREALEVTERDLATVQREIDKAYRLYMDDRISPAGFQRLNDPLEARRAELERQLPIARGEIDFLKIQALSRDEILTGARDLFEQWTRMDGPEKRNILEAVCERIVIGKSDVTVELCYQTVPLESLSTEQHGLTDSSRRRASRAPAARSIAPHARCGPRRARAAAAASRARDG